MGAIHNDLCINVIKDKNAGEIISRLPTTEIKMLQTLYFPDFETLTEDITKQVSKFLDEIYAIRLKNNRFGLTQEQREQEVNLIYDGRFKEISSLFQRFNAESQKTMQSLILPEKT